MNMNLALLAYFQGIFNTCLYSWIDVTHCKVTIQDNSNDTVGSFIAEYDLGDGNPGSQKIINITDDTGMNNTNVTVITPPVFIAPTPVQPVPAEVKTFDPSGNLVATNEPVSLPAPKKKKGGPNA